MIPNLRRDMATAALYVNKNLMAKDFRIKKINTTKKVGFHNKVN